MPKRALHRKWFEDIQDLSLSGNNTMNDSLHEKYVKDEYGDTSLEKDLLSLKLDNMWESLKYDHVDNWMTVNEFREIYANVFDDLDLKDGMDLMVNAAKKSRSAIVANNDELPFQLYSRLMGYSSKYDIIRKYLSCLVDLSSMELLPMDSYWPDPQHSEFVEYYHIARISTVCLAANNDEIIFGSHDNDVNIYSIAKADITTTLTGHIDWITSVSTSLDRKRIVSGSADHTVRIWEFQPKDIKCKILDGHTASVNSVSLSQNGRWLASGSDDRTVRLWDCNKEKVIATQIFRGHTKPVTCVSISSDGQWIVSGSKDCSVRIWNASGKGIPSNVLQGHSGPVTCVSVRPDGKSLVSGSTDRSIRIWGSDGEITKAKILKGHKSSVNCVSMSLDGKVIVSGSNDRTVRIWPQTSGSHSKITESKILQEHSSFVRSVTMSSNGDYAISGSDDRTIKRWSCQGSIVTVEDTIPQSNFHTSWVNSVSVSEDNQWIVSGSDDETVRLWDTKADNITSVVLQGHRAWVRSVAISPDGDWVVASGLDSVQMWDRPTGQLKFVFFAEQSIQSVLFHSSKCFSVNFRNSSVVIELEGKQLCDNDMLANFSVSSISDLSSHSVIRNFSHRYAELQTKELADASSLTSDKAAPSSSKMKSVHGKTFQKKSNIFVSICEYFNDLSMSSHHHPGLGQDKAIEKVDDDDINQSKKVNILCIRGEPKISEEITYPRAAINQEIEQSKTPYFCEGDSIYKSGSKKRIARLPSPVRSNIPNAVVYNRGSKTLIVFLLNHMTCFYRVNEDKQDELGIEDFMEVQSALFGTPTSSADRSLFNYFRLSSSKIRMMNGTKLLDQYCDGIFIGLSTQNDTLGRKDIFEFRYQQDEDSLEMVLIADPNVLTPLGLSILFWMLPITESNRLILKAIMVNANVFNCFSNEVTGGNGASDPTALVIPQEWAIQYNITNDFIVKHSVLGDFGICIGMDGRPSSSTERSGACNFLSSHTSQPERSRRGLGSRLLSWVRRRAPEPVLFIKQTSTSINEPHEGQLIYKTFGRPGPLTTTAHVTLAPSLIELGADFDMINEKKRFQTNGREWIMVSLNMFTARNMEPPYEGLHDRMEALGKQLDDLGIFPSNEEKGFLDQMLSKWDIGDGQRIHLLEDCDVKAGPLRKRGCRQLNREDKFYVLVPKSGCPAESDHIRTYLAFSGKTDQARKVITVDEMTEMTEDKISNEDLSIVTFDLL